jgi:nucleoside-diphosphate-sugar epimerase
MNILLTGAKGFIGSEIYKSLSSSHQITGTTRSKKDHLPYVELKSNDSIEKFEALSQGIDTIIHCAGRAHVLSDDLSKASQLFKEANIEYSVKLAEAAKKLGVKRFIYFSSIGVFGNGSSNVLIDETNKPSPTALYAKSKLEAENAIKSILVGTNVDLVIVRPPLVYAAQAPGNFERLVKISKLPIPLLFTRIQNRRSMVSLNNMVHFIKHIVNFEHKINDVFIVCDNESISTNTMIKTMRIGMNKTNLSVKIPQGFIILIFRILGKQELYNKVFGDFMLSNHRAKEKLGWSPKESAYDALENIGKKLRVI